MKMYMAPLEGLTGFIYRNAHAKYFGKMDKYFTPFISPTMHNKLTPREKNDILPENNQGLFVVPQILANNADYFIQTSNILKDYGYDEVNLNLGCPSATVVTKGKGSGFLNDLDKLDAFLKQVFKELDIRISIKTRLGVEDASVHRDIIDVFNRYPLEEVIIHPRIQKDFYKNEIRFDEFSYMKEHSKNSICYNGDINYLSDYKKIIGKYPDLERVMLGRGVMQNPRLANNIIQEEMQCVPKDLSQADEVKKLQAFLDEVLEGYREIMREDRNAMFRMKELWTYMIKEFPTCEKQGKKIKKAQNVTAYKDAVREIIETID